jgi:uroporphyrinogen decarboxylase
MNKRELFRAAVQGAAVERPPVTAWVHFLSDHLPGEETARLHQRFLEAYDWDVLKVMNDYRYPVPAGVQSFEDPESLRAFQPLGLDEPAFAEQLKCLSTLRAALGPGIALVDTMFDPYQQMLRNVGFSEAANLQKHGKEALRALDAVGETLVRYIQAVKAQGVDALFLSINGAIREGFPRGSPDEVYREFQRPFDLRLLEAAQGMVRILHVHGVGLEPSRVLDYPCEVISVSDRLPGNPSLAELRKMTKRCLMGGIDETKIQERTLPSLAREVDDALAQAGPRNFILAPGCTIPSFSPQRTLRFLRAYTKGGRRP